MTHGTYNSEDALASLRDSLNELAHMATGSHQTSDPEAYRLVRTLKSTAQVALKFIDNESSR